MDGFIIDIVMRRMVRNYFFVFVRVKVLGKSILDYVFFIDLFGEVEKGFVILIGVG